MTIDAVGRVWSYGFELARGLRRRGIEVVLAAMGPPPTVERHYGPISASWSVIHNAVRPAPGRPTEKQPFILSAGRVWDGAKNLATLGRASDAISWKVKIAGPLASTAGDGQRGRREGGA